MSDNKKDKKEKKGVDPSAPLTHKGLGALEAARQALLAREAELAKASKTPPKPPAPVPTKKPASAKPEVWRPDLDKEMLSIALSGVVPLKPDVTRKPQGNARAPISKTAARAKKVGAQGDAGLHVRWSEQGGCEGARKGRAFALESLGRFVEPEETLDLHGLDADTALLRVQEFVRSRRARGRRVVAVLHGRGLHSPDGRGVLRDAAVRALSEVPGCAEVDAFRGEPDGPLLLVALHAGR